MPCYTVQLNTVKLTAADPDLLKAAVLDLGHPFTRTGAKIRLSTPSGQVTIEGGVLKSSSLSVEALEALRNDIQQAYSRQAVYLAARTQGWKVKQVGANQYEVQR